MFSSTETRVCNTYMESQQKTQQKQIEQVQRNAARFVKNKQYNPERPDSVTSVIQEIKWNTLEQRRIWTDVTLMY